ncbi:hypothetical protein B0H11DRAFT_2256515 [Mycena galericulata]|nr:hypothetical protein B0H11DRAFT_2256515 [Mycena galericulata]
MLEQILALLSAPTASEHDDGAIWSASACGPSRSPRGGQYLACSRQNVRPRQARFIISMFIVKAKDDGPIFQGLDTYSLALDIELQEPSHACLGAHYYRSTWAHMLSRSPVPQEAQPNLRWFPDVV